MVEEVGSAKLLRHTRKSQTKAHVVGDRIADAVPDTVSFRLDSPIIVVGKLPYGLQKRVELGRALAMEPDLLLLDEPMAGMNLEEKEDMSRFILDVNQQFGTTIALIEHDMGVVMDLSDRVVVLEYGRKIADGKPDEVKGLVDAHTAGLEFQYLPHLKGLSKPLADFPLLAARTVTHEPRAAKRVLAWSRPRHGDCEPRTADAGYRRKAERLC